MFDSFFFFYNNRPLLDCRLLAILCSTRFNVAGHAEVESTGEQGHEEGNAGRDRDHNPVLRDVRVHWVRRIRERCTRELPHGVRVLRALLAHRLR